MKKLPIATCSNHIRDTRSGQMFGIIGYAENASQAQRIALKHLSREDRQLINCGFELHIIERKSDDIGNCCGEDYFQRAICKK